ncbi:MAG: hypothetical protein ACRELE_08560, partial [Gemmatimonadales bacterium]
MQITAFCLARAAGCCSHVRVARPACATRLLGIALAIAVSSISAQDEAGRAGGLRNRERPGVWVLGAQVNLIGQSLGAINSPYAGPNSLTADGDRQMSQAYGVYLGARVIAGLQAYVDVEMIRGSG